MLAANDESKIHASGFTRWYVLAIMLLINFFNMFDRQIITILAPALKADLNFTDAQLGLMFGTAFALFYGMMGIPLSKLADEWSRVKTLALGLSLWSTMTAVSGIANNFVQLGLARIGVGIGEASASPAAISLLCDYFPKRMRATILALYYTGIYVGAGASLIVGGLILTNWDGQFGLRGWQAAFIICGLPGLLLAALVLLTIREPAREHIMQPCSSRLGPFGSVLKEAAAIIPPWSIFSLVSLRAPRRTIFANVATLFFTVMAIWLITSATDDLLSPERRGIVGRLGYLTITTNLIQWVAIGISVYGFISWVQALKLRNPVAYKFVIQTPAFVGILCCSGLLSVFLYGISAFVFLYATRYLGYGPSMGATLGLISAFGGGFGMFLGGLAADRFKRIHPAGRLYFISGMLTIFAIFTWIQFSTDSSTIFLVSYLLALLALTGWNPVIAATAQDLVPANMRGTAAATTALTSSIVGLGLGPYLVGFVSDVTGDLRLAITSTLWVLPPALACLIYCARRLPAAEETVRRHMLGPE